MNIGEALEILMTQPMEQAVIMRMRGQMTIGQALEEIGSPEFAKRMNTASDVNSLIVMSMREPAVKRIREEIDIQRVWQRVHARTQVLVGAPTILGDVCEEDVAVAVLLWLLRRAPVGDFIRRIMMGPVWWWAHKMVEKITDIDVKGRGS